MLLRNEEIFWRRFETMSVAELHDVYRLRSQVFVIEQSCIYQDIDGRDPEAVHLLARTPLVPGVAGYLRYLKEPSGSIRIGRVVTAASVRSTGLGRRLMQEALRHLAGEQQDVPVELSAQSHLERFYGSLGFVRTSGDYLEDGITHCDMRYRQHARADLIS